MATPKAHIIFGMQAIEITSMKSDIVSRILRCNSRLSEKSLSRCRNAPIKFAILLERAGMLQL